MKSSKKKIASCNDFTLDMEGSNHTDVQEQTSLSGIPFYNSSVIVMSYRLSLNSTLSVSADG